MPRRIEFLRANLYGLTRDELRYILDPKEAAGDDFPGGTLVHAVKAKEVRRLSYNAGFAYCGVGG